jgi:diguanylate cyclase (GGDEF)-like protein
MGTVDPAFTDPVLGIFNRRYLHETLPREAARARHSGQSLSVIIAAVDHLEQIATNHERQTADAVLRHAIELVQPALRHADWMARYGDDEFVIVLPATHLDGAYAAAERMRRRFAEKPFVSPLTRLGITGSFGVACLDAVTDPADDANPLLRDAENALAQSKSGGHDRVTCGPAKPLRAQATTQEPV